MLAPASPTANESLRDAYGIRVIREIRVQKNCVICESRSGHFQLISCVEQKKRPISCVVKKKVLLLQRLSEKEKATAPSEGAMQKFFGRLAQLVQSICLTSRGSAVRIRQRPPNNIPFHKDYYEGIHS